MHHTQQQFRPADVEMLNCAIYRRGIIQLWFTAGSKTRMFWFKDQQTMGGGEKELHILYIKKIQSPIPWPNSHIIIDRSLSHFMSECVAKFKTEWGKICVFLKKDIEMYKNRHRHVHVCGCCGKKNDPVVYLPHTLIGGMACSVSLCLPLLHPNLLDSSFVFISRIFCLISNEINIYILNKSSRWEGGIPHRMSVTFSHCCFTSCIRFIECVYCHSESCIETYCKAHTVCWWNPWTVRFDFAWEMYKWNLYLGIW